MDMQEQYWNYMYQLRFTISYLDLYADDACIKDRTLKTICALASSGSIAGWAVCQPLMKMWAVIIAFSQVINAIKEYLPYSTRLKKIEVSQKGLKLLYCKMEYTWFQVQNGELSEKQINEFMYEIKKEYIEYETQGLKEDVLFKNKKRNERAKKQTEEYFRTFFASRFTTLDKSI